MSTTFFSWGLIFLSALFNALASSIVKARFNALGQIQTSSPKAIVQYLWHFARSPLVFLALVTFCVAPGLWFIALKYLELSIAYPVLVALQLILVLVLGASMLSELLSVKRLIGVGLILLSLCFFYA